MTFIRDGEGLQYIPPGHDASVFSHSILKAGIDVHVTVFPPRAGMEEEMHPDEAHVFYILEGCMQVFQGGQLLATLCAGDAVHIPAKELHEIKGEGDVTLKFLVITFPEQ